MLLLTREGLNEPIPIKNQKRKGIIERCSKYFDLETSELKIVLPIFLLGIVIASAILMRMGPEILV